jgi:hypothetical protein
MSKNEKYQAEARQQGWTFVAKVDRWNASYVHDVCGQEQKSQPGHIRTGGIRCHHCMEQAWRNDATAQGWTFVAQVNAHYGNYIHNACGREQQATLNSMRRNKVRCIYCMEQAWHNEATAQGWTFVSEIDGHYAFYTHKECGHEQRVRIDAMRDGAVRCQHCKEKAWRNDATAQGWTFVAQADSQYGNYTHSCGYEKQARINYMRLGKVVCNGCGESWVTKPSNVYLLDITTTCGKRFLKVGIARAVTRRITAYGLPDGAKIKVLYAKAYATGAEASKIEKRLHKNATKIHPSIRKFKGAKKLMVSGHTECYEYSPEAANYLLFNLQF